MQFLCQLMDVPGLEGREIRVDAKSYLSAARVHLVCSGPRCALLGGYYRVSVRRLGPKSKKRYFVVWATVHSDVSSDPVPLP